MKLSDVKIGEKFFYLDHKERSNRMYLRIDLDLKILFPTLTKDCTSFADLVPVLDLTSYKISAINGNYEVEVEHDNVFI